MSRRAASFGALAWAVFLAMSGAQAQTPEETARIERGRALLANRAETGCVLCHALPGFAQGGDLGPSLVGLARYRSAEELRRRIADARLFNPETIMPAYLSLQGLQAVTAGVGDLHDEPIDQPSGEPHPDAVPRPGRRGHRLRNLVVEQPVEVRQGHVDGDTRHAGHLRIVPVGCVGPGRVSTYGGATSGRSQRRPAIREHSPA